MERKFFIQLVIVLLSHACVYAQNATNNCDVNGDGKIDYADAATILASAEPLCPSPTS